MNSYDDTSSGKTETERVVFFSSQVQVVFLLVDKMGLSSHSQMHLNS